MIAAFCIVAAALHVWDSEGLKESPNRIAYVLGPLVLGFAFSLPMAFGSKSGPLNLAFAAICLASAVLLILLKLWLLLQDRARRDAASAPRVES